MHDAYINKTERLVRQEDNWMLQKWRLMCFVVINLGNDIDDGEGRRRGRTLRSETDCDRVKLFSFKFLRAL